MKTRVTAAFFASVALGILACGGRVGSPLTVPPDGGTTIITQVDGATCVDIEAASYDQSCNVDNDCVGINVGQICEGSCFGCAPNTAINVSGEGRYEAATAPVSGGDLCPCPASSAPRCANNTCILCPFEPNGPAPPVCYTPGGDDSGITTGDDSGVGMTDGGFSDDGGFTNDAGVECVFIDLSTYDTSCVTNSDCTIIAAGQVCDGSCDCGGSPVNVDGEATYEQAVSGIVFAECPCAAELPPACVGTTCTACSGSPTDPPECGDTGG
jgi:hypothetical protein